MIVAQGDLVVPVDDARNGLQLQTMSAAELIRTTGLWLTLYANHTAREHELELESFFLIYNLQVYEVLRASA